MNLSNVSLSSTISELKERIALQCGIPPSRQKLNTPRDGPAGITPMIMRDSLQLAYYNIRSGQALPLGLKERGGRK